MVLIRDEKIHFRKKVNSKEFNFKNRKSIR